MAHTLRKPKELQNFSY